MDSIYILAQQKHYFLCFLSLFSTSLLFAQSYIDVISLGSRYYSDASYKDINNYYAQKSVWLDGKFPIQLKNNKDYVIPLLTYTYMDMQQDVYEEEKLSLHNINLGVGYLKKWKNPNWVTYTGGRLAISSDFKGINKRHFNYNATFLLRYRSSEKLLWSAGVNYDGGGFGNKIAPLIGLKWTINKRAYLSFLSFNNLTFDYKLSNRLVLGFYVKTMPFSFNLTDYLGQEDTFIHSYRNGFPFIPQDVGIKTEFYLAKEFISFWKLSYELGKQLSHGQRGGDALNESAYNGIIQPKLVFTFGLSWRKERE